MALPSFVHAIKPDPFSQVIEEAMTMGGSVMIKMKDGTVHHIAPDRLNVDFQQGRGRETGYGLIAPEDIDYDD